MPKVSVLVVEDERLIARDIQNSLEKLGYRVPATAATGEDAVKLAGEKSPDLVLMDITLKGNMDGVDAAAAIHSKFDIPVIFLTAHADKATVERAKISEPYGYLLKPFEERELQICIEIAVYKHRMEQKIRNVERWFSTMFKSIGDGVISTDKNGIIRFMNPMAEALTGWESKEALGMDLMKVFRIETPSASQSPENLIRRAAEEGLVVDLSYDSRLIRKDDTQVPIGDSIAPIRDIDDNVMGVVIVFRDTSREKRIGAIYERLQKMSAMGQLAASMAHELNNPLTVIMGFAQSALKKAQSGVDFSVVFQTIDREANRCKRLVQELLTFSRTEKTEMASCNLNEIIESTLQLLEPRAKMSEIEICLDLDRSIPEMTAIRDQVQQVIFNLSHNAMDAMLKGGQLIIRTCLKSNGQVNVQIEVEDTGKGIPTEVQANVFEPFFTTKEMGKGTGLGLTICKEIIQRHNGTIKFASKAEKGTTFTVKFPVQAAVP